MKIGLALGSGGLKGLAHIGVLQVLEEQGIKPAVIAGTSAGSIFAALYGAGMSPYKMQEIVSQLAPEDYLDYNISGLVKHLLGLLLPCRPYALEGIYYGRKLERLMADLTQGKKLLDARIPLALVAADINTGEEIVFASHALHTPGEAKVIRKAGMSEAVRASTAIPVVFNPKMVQGRKLVDGGLKNSVPTRWVSQLGADYIIAVDLGQKYYTKPVEGMVKIAGRSLDMLIFETSDVENDRLADLVLYPAVEDIGLEDIAQAPDIIQAGRAAMAAKLNTLPPVLYAS
jgi:NTE family protein